MILHPPPLPKGTSVEVAKNRMAALVVYHHDAIRKAVAELTDEEILATAEALEIEASKNCIGLRVEDFDCVADQLRAEVSARRMFAAADE